MARKETPTAIDTSMTPGAILDIIRQIDPVQLWDVLTAKCKEADEIRTREMQAKERAEADAKHKEEEAHIRDCMRLAAAQRELEEKRKAEEAKITTGERMGAFAKQLEKVCAPSTPAPNAN